MGYLKEFQVQIDNRDFPKFLQLWEEYCTSDSAESDEFILLLQAIKIGDLARPFGQIVETAIPLWKTITDKTASYDVLKLLVDLQITNSPLLAEMTIQALKEKYGEHPELNERLRLVGLRNRENFQGALASFDLLVHMQKGKFVLHTSGWGAGQIVDVSPVREQVSIEFEFLPGRKHLTFENAFKTLVPLKDDSFLARRFSDPDRLEADAKENPVAVIKLLLQDLGPKTAAEIKDELCELVIPEKDWVKWWQGARAKIKKDPMLETPETLRDVFRLRHTEVSHEERLHKAINNKTDVSDLIQTSYNFVRDLPKVRQNQEIRDSVRDKLVSLQTNTDITKEQELQIYIFLESLFGHQIEGKHLDQYIQQLSNVEELINAIEILAFKKRALTLVREHRKDWDNIFLSMFFTTQQSTLKDYILKELNQGSTKKSLQQTLKNLLDNPAKHPETFVWYFQKLVNDGNEDIPYSDKEGQCAFFEGFLILFNALENKPDYRDLLKKMYLLLSGKRYAVVRAIIQGTSLEFINEFLLLVSKCQSLSDHDLKILRSLAEVVHPSLAAKGRKAGAHVDANTIWTTEEGYLKTQERIRHIGTKEVIENAREVEAARALGDLRENSEYKFAVEKRGRLQGELKTLSEQLHRARIITPQDIHPGEVGIGNIVVIADSAGKKTSYTILGPWDADAEKNILSFQSKLAEAMIGLKEGNTFNFRNEDYKIVKIQSFFEQ